MDNKNKLKTFDNQKYIRMIVFVRRKWYLQEQMQNSSATKRLFAWKVLQVVLPTHKKNTKETCQSDNQKWPNKESDQLKCTLNGKFSNPSNDQNDGD